MKHEQTRKYEVHFLDRYGRTVERTTIEAYTRADAFRYAASILTDIARAARNPDPLERGRSGLSYVYGVRLEPKADSSRDAKRRRRTPR